MSERNCRYYIGGNQKGIFIHIPKTAGSSIYRCTGEVAPRMIMAHASASFVRQIIGEEDWGGVFTFTFVRNPWARHVSWYLYCQRELGYKNLSFTDYVVKDRALVIHCASIDFLTGGYWSQKLFVCRGDEVIVDFIGQFENLQDDFDHVCGCLGIPNELPKINTAPKYDYRSFYTSQTIELIAKRCAWEIEKFGYEF